MMFSYQLCTPGAWLASRLYSPTSLVWAISLSMICVLISAHKQTNITAKNTAMEHACNWTRISTVDFLKKQFLGYLFSEPKSFWNFRQDSSAMRAIRLATEFHVN